MSYSHSTPASSNNVNKCTISKTQAPINRHTHKNSLNLQSSYVGEDIFVSRILGSSKNENNNNHVYREYDYRYNDTFSSGLGSSSPRGYSVTEVRPSYDLVS
jgi:hypothetical protein